MRELLVVLLVCLATVSSAETYPAAAVRVVDGDTFWIAGEKIRLAGADTPEPTKYGNAKCAHEAQLGDNVTVAVTEWIKSARVVKIERDGIGFYQRPLAHVWIDGVDLAETLIRVGAAQEYKGRKGNWCD